MNKIDWKRKLTSRKFWMAVISFITAVLVVFNVSDLTIEQVSTLVMAFGTVIAYIIGEGLGDSARINSSTEGSVEGVEDKEGE